jgi:drug/metabolite transporter (DMT)-like permease
MDRNRYMPFAALAGAGLLWGLTVPLSKLAMGWLDPAWLTVARFAVSAPLLAVIGRRSLSEALQPRVAVAGAIGFGGVIVLQNAGIERTSVSHAAVILGTVPVLVALMTAAVGQGRARPRTWSGSGLALVGIALVAGANGLRAISPGDLLVLASAVLSAGFISTQPRLLKGQAPAAITAVQFAAAAMVAVPIAMLIGGAPAAPANADAVLVFVALALVGTLLPFWLFAFGQARVTPDVAGAFVNLEPLVGAAIGWLAFGDAAAPQQVGGAFAVLAGILLATLPRRGERADSLGTATSPRRACGQPRHAAGSRGDPAGSRGDPADSPRDPGRNPPDHARCESGRMRHRRIKRRCQGQRRTVPMIHAPGRGPQKRLSLAWPRLSPIRK